MADVLIPFGSKSRKNAKRTSKANQIKTSKYTWCSFLPKNIYEQLHKFGNCYFLLISVIMYLGEKTPLYVGTIKAFSTVGVLVMMMAVTATMALLDDLRRKEADNEINNAEAHSWPWGARKPVSQHWEDVAVGDILLVREDDEFPADMVPLFCSGEGGNCYVSTANLDGETNLKLKSAAKAVQKACTHPKSVYNPEIRRSGLDKLELQTLEMITKLKGTVVAEEPNGNIHDFKGSLELDSPSKSNESLGATQLLMRGTVLRNTALCVGIVVYCGVDTRMIRNSRPAPAKISTLEFFTNNSMKLILVAQGCLALLSAICFSYNKWYFAGLWYVHLRDDLWLPDIPAYWLTFFTLYSNLMPISLYPTTEFCNAMQSFFIRNDKKMVYCAEDFDNGVPFAARARSSNLCQELGQIQYLFSDKTGTLTQNVMELKRLSINGEKYGRLIPKEVGFNGAEELGRTRKHSAEAGRPIESFLEVLAVAHTVMVSKGRDNQLDYEAESPDEHALVKAASNLGWRFESRKGNTLTCSQVSSAGGLSAPASTLPVPSRAYESHAPERQFLSCPTHAAPTPHAHLVMPTSSQAPMGPHVSRHPSSSLPPTIITPLPMTPVSPTYPLLQSRSTFATPGVPLMMLPPGQPNHHYPVENLPHYYPDEQYLQHPGPPSFQLPHPVMISSPQGTHRGRSPDKFFSRPHPGPAPTGTSAPGPKHTYTLLATNAFTSSRKRMSIVVKKDEQEYLLFVKGADNVMMERAQQGVDYLPLMNDLKEFSQEGLRTLVIGQKKLEAGHVQQWLNKYEEANRKTAGREEALDKAAEELEKDIEVLGATAIEDKLQDEVSETIEKIRMAGIKLWVLTGDKLETARNIGYSTKVLEAGMNIQTLDEEEEGGKDLKTVTKALQPESSGQAMMVTGKALAGILGNQKDKDRFLRAAQTCEVLIACRVSPMQKAELVRLVREAAPRGREPVTAAIGDGANDVPMLQEAQVGIGIAGREGRQSVNNSDFAIGQFQYLQQLLFVHGRWNYLRACKFTLFTFWRNMVQVLIMFSYTFFSGFSGTVLFEDWLRLSFNGFGTIPVLALGAFDQDVPANVACKHPQLYEVGREYQELNFQKTLQTFIAAVFHAAVIVSVTLLAYPGMDLWGAGDYYTFGSAVYTCLIIDLTYRVAFLTCSHNRYTMGAIAFTLCMYVFFLLVYPCVSFMANFFEPNMYMVPAHMVSNANFWICILVIPMICWSVDSFTSWVKHTVFPDAVDDIKLENADYQTETSIRDDEHHNGDAVDSEDMDDLGDTVDLTPYGQQQLKSWSVRTTAPATMKITFGCGIVLLLLGCLLQHKSSEAAQVRVIYQMAEGGATKLASEIPWGTMDNEVFHGDTHCNPGTNHSHLCNVVVPRNMKPPLLVYYGVGPFYQNIVTYIKSEVPRELRGMKVSEAAREEKCLNIESRKRNGKDVVPCGMKATTLFNDTLELHHSPGNRIEINKKGVAWSSDVRRYQNPGDYLNRSNTMWLYELFPDVLNKVDGVKNEAFAAWMRPAALGRVWNHYGWVNERLNKGETISFRIKSSFNATVESSKMFVITERNVFGARHTTLGVVLMAVGGVCLFFFLGVLLTTCVGQHQREHDILHEETWLMSDDDE